MERFETKLVLLGTGTPNACPNASGPASAVVVGDRAYLVDFGPGVVRQASKAYFAGIDALRPDLLCHAFCTHLHTDHTTGYPDLIFTPWVLERAQPLKVNGEETHMVWMPYSFGFKGLSTGPSTNYLTNDALDPNSEEQEFKACLVNVQKA